MIELRVGGWVALLGVVAVACGPLTDDGGSADAGDDGKVVNVDQAAASPRESLLEGTEGLGFETAAPASLEMRADEAQRAGVHLAVEVRLQPARHLGAAGACLGS